MGKRKYGFKIIVILLTICVLLEHFACMEMAEAAEGRYGIWCPICGKWQDHFNGVVTAENLVVTEYVNGEMECGNGKITIECIDCGKKLMYIKKIDDYSVYDVDTEDEYIIYWEDYEILTYESTVIFPTMEVHADETSDNEGAYYTFAAQGNAFGATGGSVSWEKFKEGRAIVSDLFISLANCLTKTEKTNVDSNIVSKNAITDKEFTWTEWYDSGTRIDTSGNNSSMLIWYLEQFGLTALRQNSYTVTFYANGGAGSMGTIMVSSGNNTLPANTFSRDGYSFLGWSTSPDGAVQYANKGNVVVAENMELYAVWQKMKEPPVLEVTGDVEVKLYRNGALIDGAVNAGDKVEIILVKRKGREYAQAKVSTNPTDLVWNGATGILSFTMPDADTSVQIFCRELQSLEVTLNSLFYEIYQKAPYWNGESFDVDCGEAIVVQKNMVDVKAVFYHTGTGQTEKRAVTDFTFVGANQIQNLGKNTIVTEADVLKDGYVLSGQCVLTADSASLSQVMEQTDSQTYTELKEFVEGLTEELAECESVIDVLTENLTISEEERQKCEQMLAEAVAEAERLEQELAVSEGELADVSQELESVKEKLTLMQELMQEMTGSTEIDAATVEELKKKFQEIEQEKVGLTEKMQQLEQENAELTDKLTGLEQENAGLTDKVSGLETENAGLTDKVSGLETENAGLTDKVSGLETENAGLTDKVSGLETENAGLTDKVSGLETENAGLTDKVNGMEAENAGLTDKLSGLESAAGSMAEKYAILLRENEKLMLEKERMKKTNEELSDQLKYTLEEQAVLFKEYELLKENYTVLLGIQQQKESEYSEKLAVTEQALAQVKQEKEQLAGQVETLEREKQELQSQGEKWKAEKEELSSTVQILRAENKEWREQLQNKDKQNTQSGISGVTQSGNTEQQTSETAKKEQEKEQEMMQSDKLTHQGEGIVIELESQTVDETTQLEKETDKVEADRMPTKESYTDESRNTELSSENNVEQEETSLQEQGFGVAARNRSILPGIAVVVVAMLLGGAVLYLALGQKEKTANYTCD